MTSTKKIKKPRKKGGKDLLPEAEKIKINGVPVAITVIEALIALDNVCDGARTKDGAGFSKYDRETYSEIIDKAVNKRTLLAKEEDRANKFLKKYSNQLKALGIDYNEIEHIPRADNEVDISDDVNVPANTNPVLTSEIEDIRILTLDTTTGVVGFSPEHGDIRIVKYENNKTVFGWISDCVVRVAIETVAKDKKGSLGEQLDTEFTFRGVGAKDHRKVKFTMKARDLADQKKFTAELYNYFGSKNKPGSLTFKMVQDMSLNQEVVRRIEVPEWIDGIPMIPGMTATGAVEYRLSSMIPAEVYDGDIEAAKKIERDLLNLHPNAPLVIVALMAAPLMAIWRPDDRVLIAIWGDSGGSKTSLLKVAMCVFGVGYNSDRFLLKHDAEGATMVGRMNDLEAAGFLAEIYDNVKTTDPRSHERYVSVVHNVIEGSGKRRGKKDGGNRESREFLCTLLVTGEVRPEEASTDARVFNVNWWKCIKSDRLTEIQTNVKPLPIIGYHWLKFLADFIPTIEDRGLDAKFVADRSSKEQEYAKAGYFNPGRLANIYTVLRFTWDRLCESPFDDVFQEKTEDFKQRLDEAIKIQGDIVNNDTELAKFLAGVSELLASQRGLFQEADIVVIGDKKFSNRVRVIGKEIDKEGLFLIPNETLAELNKLKVFTQIPTVSSMSKTLDEAGLLIKDPDMKHRLIGRRVNDSLVRGWLLKPDAFETDPDVTTKEEGITTGETQVVTEKQ